MPRPYDIPIVEGSATEQILNGAYDVTAVVVGYDNTSIQPDTVNVTAGDDAYAFTIAATGTMTLHVTETGVIGGPVIIGATFVRCDASGAPYGATITTDENGNAEFPFMPFAASDAPIIYYKQTASVGEHEFDETVQNTTMITDTLEIEVENAPGEVRTITLTDANYANLKIAEATIRFS